MSEAGTGGTLQLSGVSRSFGGVKAVDRVSVTIEEGEFVTLLGPSGCGKTTALRLIAGFERPDEGSIRFAGDEVTEWTPQRRGFGMVFQSYALFPHLNVFENVAFGLKARRFDLSTIRQRVQSALEIVDLGAYAERSVQALSGGQQQRVAVARAVAIEPPLLLLDEPLSNLDQALRVQTRNDLRRLVKSLGITALFVTHDQEEAFDLSDRIAVMSSGRIHQIGSPRHLYEEPADRFVAGFVGRANVLSVRSLPEGIRLSDRVIWPLPLGTHDMHGMRHEAGPDEPSVLLVRPEDLQFVDAGGVDVPPLDGVVRDRRFRGGSVLYRVETQDTQVAGTADRVEEGESAGLEIVGPPDGPVIGDHVRVAPRPKARLHLFPDEAVT